MEIGSLLLILALLILVAFFVGRPFLENPSTEKVETSDNREEHERSALLAERDRLLNAIKELDFDHVLGKIPEEEYPDQRAILVHRGIQVFKQLDALQSTNDGQNYDERMLVTLAHQEQDRLAPPLSGAHNGRQGANHSAVMAISTPDDELEVMIASRRRNRSDKAAGFCPKCGAPQQVSDRFCPKCGAKTN